MNCIRLLEQGIELLDTGNLTIPRPNADELKAIKKGRWSYKQVEGKYTGLLQQIDEAVNSSILPDKTDLHKAEMLMVSIVLSQIK